MMTSSTLSQDKATLGTLVKRLRKAKKNKQHKNKSFVVREKDIRHIKSPWDFMCSDTAFLIIVLGTFFVLIILAGLISINYDSGLPIIIVAMILFPLMMIELDMLNKIDHFIMKKKEKIFLESCTGVIAKHNFQAKVSKDMEDFFILENEVIESIKQECEDKYGVTLIGTTILDAVYSLS